MWAHQKFPFRKSFYKGSYKVFIAKTILRDEEIVIEFIDTPGYDKTATDWARPLQRIMTECFEATYRAKRSKRYQLQGSCEKAEYDYNVWV